MNRLRFLTAGESHGPGLAVIIEGLPAGLALTGADINRDLARRQAGYGRGGRMSIEKDRAEILSGIRKGLTLGSPVALIIRNRDWENWRENMSVEPGPPAAPVTCPRPGHADLAGLVKYGFTDVRNVLERASARETAARVAAGAAARKLLAALSINIYSRVVRIGTVTDRSRFNPSGDYERIEASRLRCRSTGAEKRMAELIDRVQAQGESLGGVFEIVVTGLPVGLGSYVHWDRRLDGRLAQALASIPAIKGVEIGAGFRAAALTGHRVQDEIFHDARRGYFRKSNRAGGLEGGVTNGEPLVLRAAMKPIPTQSRPLRTIDISSRRPALANRERSDTCAVPAAAVVGEAMTALVLADACLEKYGGDTLPDLRPRKNGV